MHRAPPPLKLLVNTSHSPWEDTVSTLRRIYGVTRRRVERSAAVVPWARS